jgi:hypothetical protein
VLAFLPTRTSCHLVCRWNHRPDRYDGIAPDSVGEAVLSACGASRAGRPNS